MCPIKLCIILVKQPASAHFGDDWKSGLIAHRLSFFVESESDARVRLRRPYAHPRFDSTRVSARSRDAYVTILHFRAVIDGVDTSRCALDLDASSFLSFLMLIQLVPTQTRRARLPKQPKNKHAGGNCCYTARTVPVRASSSSTRSEARVVTQVLNQIRPSSPCLRTQTRNL